MVSKHSSSDRIALEGDPGTVGAARPFISSSTDGSSRSDFREPPIRSVGPAGIRERGTVPPSFSGRDSSAFIEACVLTGAHPRVAVAAPTSELTHNL